MNWDIIITYMSQQGSDFQIERSDSEFNDHEDYIDGGQQVEQHEEHHLDHFEEAPHDYEDMDLSFERDVSLLTKVKAKIMFNINKERQLEQLPLIYQDITLSSIAMQYATSIKTGSSNQSYLKKLCEDLRNDADFKTCQLIANYEEDVQITKTYQEKFFIQNSYLFFEMDKERELLLDPNTTNIGIGLAGNESTIAIVLFVTQRQITILEIDENQHTNQIEVRGKMLEFSIGICGVKICSAPGGDYREIATAHYDKIDFNRQTKQFCVYLDLQPNWKERRWIELWTRLNPDSIGYRKPRKEKDKGNHFRHLQMKMRSLFILYPDKKFIQCYQDQAEAEQNRSLHLSNILVEPHKQEQPQEKPEDMDESNAQAEEQEEEPEEQEEDVKEQALKENMTSNKEIKEELVLAISEAKNTYDGLYDHNRMMQSKIKDIRQKNHIYIDKTNEASMNQHKYLNILAQVHQTRVELQETQNRYNKMSLELQNKLTEKQSKCNDIRTAFQELKREVAKKATYSRSELPIKQHKIEEWEERESRITEELQNLRLQILRARNTLAKNQKILKKKEELAEGLHLIDFEQLKIENQTLNEKIEERNEDLHKLKKKTTTMVQILTHTREKLVYVQKMRASLKSTADDLDSTIQSLRGEINAIKENCERLRLEIQDAKQETEIVNSQQLVVDFKKRAQNISKIQQQIKAALQRQKEMKTVIEMYQRKVRKEGLVK